MFNPTKLRGIVKKIIKYGEDVYQVFFETYRLIRFKPGQFLHLSLDEYDPCDGYWPESRVFSIASLPGVSEVEIVYSVKGEYTRRMSDELIEGREVWLKLPYGDFVIDNHVKYGEKTYMIAGGTGIAPFISFLRSNISNCKYRLKLYYGIRDKNYYLYRDFLEDVKDKIDLRIIYGMMDVEEISDDIVKHGFGRCFISGPPLMIGNFRSKLVDKGFREEDIIIDEW